MKYIWVLIGYLLTVGAFVGTIYGTCWLFNMLPISQDGLVFTVLISQTLGFISCVATLTHLKEA